MNAIFKQRWDYCHNPCQFVVEIYLFDFGNLVNLFNGCIITIYPWRCVRLHFLFLICIVTQNKLNHLSYLWCSQNASSNQCSAIAVVGGWSRGYTRCKCNPWKNPKKEIWSRLWKFLVARFLCVSYYRKCPSHLNEVDRNSYKPHNNKGFT